MAVAPSWWSVAAGEGASAVAQREGSAEWAGEQSPSPSDIEDLAVAAEAVSQRTADLAGVDPDTAA